MSLSTVFESHWAEEIQEHDRARPTRSGRSGQPYRYCCCRCRMGLRDFATKDTGELADFRRFPQVCQSIGESLGNCPRQPP